MPVEQVCADRAGAAVRGRIGLVLLAWIRCRNVIAAYQLYVLANSHLFTAHHCLVWGSGALGLWGPDALSSAVAVAGRTF